MEMLDHTYYGNTVLEWLTAMGIVFGGVVLSKVAYWIFQGVGRKLTEKTETRLDDIVLDLAEEPFVFGIALGSVWFAFKSLTLPDTMMAYSGKALHLIAACLVAWLLSRLFDSFYKEVMVPLAEKSETDLDDQLLPIVRRGVRTIIWGLAIIIGLNNAGYDVGAMLAGLGIGGLALAMAAKDTVSNMFGGFTIFTDQPFKLKDRVVVGGYDGMVEEIGLRSTRIRTLDGRLVTVPNSQFAESPVQNVSAEPNRKIVMTLGLTYDMKAKDLEAAVETLKAIVAETEGTEENVIAGFTGFGDFALEVLFIYYITKGADIVGVQNEINLKILRQFEDKGLDMAFPTQTLHVVKDAA